MMENPHSVSARTRLRHIALFSLLVAAIPLGFAWALTLGSVDISVREILSILAGGEGSRDYFRAIVMESRLPMACSALLSGASLGLAGLLMQTSFQNPLAGPSVLGVSSGATLGVALVTLTAGMAVFSPDSAASLRAFTSIAGAFAGSLAVMLVLVALSSVLRSGVMLLITGIFFGYLTSSVISLLNFFSPPDEVKAFMVWGLGSFASLTLGELPWMALATFVFSAAALAMAKPLNALLLGERYAETMGYPVRTTRNWLLILSGALTAVSTAFCGPVGFIGLAVPHMARISFNTSNHNLLLPATLLWGAVTGLACVIISLLPSGLGVLPVNAVTPLIGVPVILYVILRRRSLNYFN